MGILLTIVFSDKSKFFIKQSRSRRRKVLHFANYLLITVRFWYFAKRLGFSGLKKGKNTFCSKMVRKLKLFYQNMK